MFSYFVVGMTLAVGQTSSMPTPVHRTGAVVASQQATPMPPAAAAPDNAQPPAKADCNGGNGAKDEKSKDDKSSEAAKDQAGRCFLRRFWDANKDEFCKKEKADAPAAEEPEKPRRANPAPFQSPPLPSSEWQGYPNIGVPPTDFSSYPLMKALLAGPGGEYLKDSRINFYGWVTGSANYSTSKETNVPASYTIVPNRAELDQAVIRFEREPDTVQTDHMDWGFRLTNIYGIDYRYTTAGGYGSEQLLNHNLLYGDDPLEIYAEVYVPGIADGLNIRVGRYISPPDIEAQLAPDNYLASHSILFTYDNYTQTGVLGTLKLNDQWMVQAGINAGGDMAPWYKGALATGFFGVRWISKDNRDSIYTCLNDINSAEFRHFAVEGQPAGHDNYNYVVSTWTHKFSDKFVTATEAYYMWQRNAVVGGTPSIGPVEPFGSGGGIGATIPGTSTAYGVLNYTAIAISKQDYITLRNEWWDDPQGMRSGFATSYSSHTIGIAHNFNQCLQIRPEIGYYHSYNAPSFDNGTRTNQVMFVCDVTYRF
jgi:Putative beta-barrel porin-2, OmpL-like. bbp2